MADMTKCTMLLQVGTIDPNGRPARLGGFSESWYTPNVFGLALLGAFSQLASGRAALLPASGAVVGLRFQKLINGTVAQSSTSQPINLPGSSGQVTDEPNVSIKVQLNGNGLPNKKILILRGIPDENVIKGEYSPSSQFRSNLTTFLSNLIGTPWSWRGRSLTETSFPILTISATGAYQLSSASTIPDNTTVQVLRARNVGGRQKGGFFFNKFLTPFTGTLVGWNHGDCTGGRMRVAAVVFPTPAAFIIPPSPVAISKKVGRPFSQYRGRKSVKSPG